MLSPALSTHTTQPATRPTTRLTSPATPSHPLNERFSTSCHFPTEFRARTQHLSWSQLRAEFAPTATLRITNLTATPLRDGRQRYHAAIATLAGTRPGHRCIMDTIATGPVAACLDILHRCGRFVEVTCLRQYPVYEATLTLVKVSHQQNHRLTAWSFGFGATPEASTAAALSSAAQRVYG